MSAANLSLSVRFRLPITARTTIEYGSPFISAPQLGFRPGHCFCMAVRALPLDLLGVLVVFGYDDLCLRREFGTKYRRKVVRLGYCRLGAYHICAKVMLAAMDEMQVVPTNCG